MKVDINIYFHDSEAFTEIKTLLSNLIQQGEKMAGEVQKLEQDVAENTTVVESAITLMQNIKALLDAAGTDPAKLAALSQALENNSTKLAAAVAANTPGATPPVDPNA